MVKKGKHAKKDSHRKHHAKTEHKPAAKKVKVKKSVLWQISTAVLGILLAVSIFTGGFNTGAAPPAADEEGGIGKDVAAAEAMDHINNNLLAPGTEAELLSVKEEGGLYHMRIEISGQEFDSYVSLDGKTLYPSSIALDGEAAEAAEEEETAKEEEEAAEEPVEEVEKKGTFTAHDDELCTEDGKPLIMLFTTTWCPHCTWIKDTYDATVKEYGDTIQAHHWELDTGDDTLTEEVETEVPAELKEHYKKYNPRGSIPTFVFGCKYSRIGNGHERSQDLDAEADEFREIIDELIA